MALGMIPRHVCVAASKLTTGRVSVNLVAGGRIFAFLLLLLLPLVLLLASAVPRDSHPGRILTLTHRGVLVPLPRYSFLDLLSSTVLDHRCKAIGHLQRKQAPCGLQERSCLHRLSVGSV